MKIETNIKNIEKFPAEFGKAICEALGFQVKCSENVWFYSLSNSPFGVFEACEDLIIDYNFIHEAEKVVIAQIAPYSYGKALGDCLDINWFLITQSDIAKIATASSVQRLCSCLLALGINEIEVEGGSK